MKKNLFILSTIGASMLLASCGKEAKNENPAPAEAPVAYSVVENITNTGAPLGKEVKNYTEEGVIASVETHTYDKDAQKMYESEHLIYVDGKATYGTFYKVTGEQEGTDIYTYNENGLLKEQVISMYNEGLARIAPLTKYQYEYSANGDITSVKELKMGIKNWETVYEWTYQYDAQNRVVMRMDYTGEGKNRTQSCQNIWKYKEGSNQIAQEDYSVYDLKGGRLKHMFKYNYVYDKNGRITTRIRISHMLDKKRTERNSFQWTYIYNAAGQLTKMIEQKWNQKESKWFEASSTTQYEYDAEGQMVQHQRFYNTNKGERFLVSEFENPAGHVVVAPAGEVEPTKPTIDLEDKKKTSVDDED